MEHVPLRCGEPLRERVDAGAVDAVVPDEASVSWFIFRPSSVR